MFLKKFKHAVTFLGLNPRAFWKAVFSDRKHKKAHGMVDRIIMLILYIALIVAAGAAVFLLITKVS